jgi:mono/diheme cytochrome c family protein
MTRLPAAALAFALALGLAGCYDTGGSGAASPPATTAAPPAATAPPETQAAAGDPAAGEAVFASAGCSGCHTLAAAGATGTVGPNLDEAKPPLDLILDRVANGGGVMPAFAGQLSEQQIRDVAAFVSQNAGR